MVVMQVVCHVWWLSVWFDYQILQRPIGKLIWLRWDKTSFRNGYLWAHCTHFTSVYAWIPSQGIHACLRTCVRACMSVFVCTEYSSVSKICSDSTGCYCISEMQLIHFLPVQSATDASVTFHVLHSTCYTARVTLYLIPGDSMHLTVLTFLQRGGATQVQVGRAPWDPRI